MRHLSLILLLLLTVSTSLFPQATDTLNFTDSKGLKQGHWIKKDKYGNVQYDGFFKNNLPIGEFKRYYPNGKLQSVLVFKNDGKTADAVFYHQNGMKASSGMYINQLKEGKWQFYSSLIEDYLIAEEEFRNNQRNGLSVKYYANKIPSEKIIFVNGVKNGDWFQYYSSGNLFISAKYLNGKLQGKFTVYHENGKPRYAGQYLDDSRDGSWLEYNRDGNLTATINYVKGYAANPELYLKETQYLDSLERNKDKLSDPEKTGTIW